MNALRTLVLLAVMFIGGTAQAQETECDDAAAAW